MKKYCIDEFHSFLNGTGVEHKVITKYIEANSEQEAIGIFVLNTKDIKSVSKCKLSCILLDGDLWDAFGDYYSKFEFIKA